MPTRRDFLKTAAIGATALPAACRQGAPPAKLASGSGGPSGELTNFVEGTYESYGKIDVPAYSRKYSEAGFKRFETIPLAGPTSAAVAYK